MFTLPDLSFGGAKEKAQQNVRAIEIVKSLGPVEYGPERQIILEGTADDTQLAELCQYTGFGDKKVLEAVYAYGCCRHRSDNWSTHWHEPLLSLLTDEEKEALKGSAPNAHYTDPSIFRAIWSGLEAIGLNGAVKRVVETSAGIGHAIGAAPTWAREGVQWIAVELDVMTSHVLKALYPEVEVRNTGIERAKLPKNYFDLAISNVPFGDYGVHDPEVRRDLTNRIHDYFFCKALDLLKPGGVIAFITTAYTMDKEDSRYRQYIADRAELVTAIRLPETAFKKNAGTEVVTDIIVLRKRAKQIKSTDEWIKSRRELFKVECRYNSQTWMTDVHAPMNLYFQNNKEQILGTLIRSHMYHGTGFSVAPLTDVGTLQEQIERSFSRTPILKPIDAAEVIQEVQREKKHVHVDDSPVTTAMMEIYTTAKALLRAQEHDEEFTSLQQDLNAVYDRFYADNGSLRFGKKKSKRGSNGPVKLLDGTPYYSFLMALETPAGEKMPIFSKRIVQGDAEHVETPIVRDAFAQCLNLVGDVDIDWIAEKSQVSSAQVIADLKGSIYHTPSSGWVTATEYLSGDVASKLKEAVALASLNPEYRENVSALEAVQPERIEAKDIFVRLGTSWVPGDVFVLFFRSILKREDAENDYGWKTARAEFVDVVGEWKLSGIPWNIRENAQFKEWSTDRCNAQSLFEHAMNSKTPVVYDTIDDKQVKNAEATMLAQAKLNDMAQVFKSWVWEDEDRRARLETIYNDKYNGFRVCEYDGEYLTFPGLSEDITPRWYQKSAVSRILALRPERDQACVTHTVGFGKTLTAILAAFKRIQLGLSKKVMIVCKKSIKNTWVNQLSWSYPGMLDRILIADGEDFGANRETFMATIATGDYNIVLVTYEQFKKLPVTADTMNAYVQQEIDDLEQYIESLKGTDSSVSQKELEKALKRLQKKLQDRESDIDRDDARVVTFEDLGIDLVLADEAHVWKNDLVTTKMSGVKGLRTNNESDRAYDARIKCHWLLENGGCWVELTGTPVSNTIAEAYVIARRLQHRLLREKGVAHFDSWASVFCEPYVTAERDATGEWHAVTRLRFCNLPELLTMLGLSWDRADPAIVLSPDGDPTKGIVRPDMEGGKMSIVEVQGTDELRAYTVSLAERMQAIRQRRVKPDEDNALSVTSDGRKASFLNGKPELGWKAGRTTKVDALVEKILTHYHESTSDRGLQAVFCDLFTTDGTHAPIESYQWGGKTISSEFESDNERVQVMDAIEEKIFYAEGVYGVIRLRLVLAGIPDSEIAYIHDAKNDKQMEKMETDLNEGVKRVVIGSTGKMGEGKNIQKRMIALHHFCCPWKPSDLEQRNGRIQRHGNMFKTIYVYVYVVIDSYDAVNWQFIKNKAAFISQLQSGKVSSRNSDDIGSLLLTAEMAMAITSGDDRIARKFGLESDLAILYSQWKEYNTKQDRAANVMRYRPHEIERMNKDLEAHTAAAALAAKSPESDVFSMMIVPNTMTMKMDDCDDPKMAHSIITQYVEMVKREHEEKHGRSRRYRIGVFRGFDLVVYADYGGQYVALEYAGGEYRGEVRKRAHDMVRELHGMAELPRYYRGRVLDNIKNAHRDIAEAKELHGKPWIHTAKAATLLQEYKELCADLKVSPEFSSRAFESFKLEDTVTSELTVTPTPVMKPIVDKADEPMEIQKPQRATQLTMLGVPVVVKKAVRQSSRVGTGKAVSIF